MVALGILDAGVATPVGAAPDGPATLPPLRRDLHLLAGPPDAAGRPSWTIHDPVRGRYFTIGQDGLAILTRWTDHGPGQTPTADVLDPAFQATPAQIAQFHRFLAENELLEGGGKGGIAHLARVSDRLRRRTSPWNGQRLLFFRIPLLHPDRFLNATLGIVKPLFHPASLALVGALGLLGLFLVTRQWDAFTHGFAYLVSWQGFATFLAAMAVAKVLHEFGHAYMAKAFGCRVHSMGVGLMVFFPILYTDTSDAWRLVSRRQRMLIGGAGVLVELWLAVLATAVWSFLPDGPLRSAVFMLASTTWAMTLLVNLNPFMRFDGYFVLADYLGVQNLQARGFAMARWRLREWLFGFGLAPPEPLPRGLRRAVIAWAFGTWAWRLLLFVAIALLVYHFFIKVIGIAMMAMVVFWFLAKPLASECGVWWRMRNSVRPTVNLAVALCVLGGLVWLAVTPWQSSVRLPAQLQADRHVTLYPAAPARIATMPATPDRRVAAGAVLFRLVSPDLDHQIAQSERDLTLTQHLILRQAASPETLSALGVLQEQLATQWSAYHGLVDQRAALAVAAPFDGRLVDVPADLAAGRWVGMDQPLGRVISDNQALIEGYLSADDLARVQVGAVGRFIPDDITRPDVAVRVTAIDAASTPTLDTPYLVSVYGGSIAVRADENQRLVPEHAVYRVALEPLEPHDVTPDQVARGVVRLEGDARSFADRVYRAVAAVLIRESGF